MMDGRPQDSTGLEAPPGSLTMTLAEYKAKAKELQTAKAEAEDLEERKSLHGGRRTHTYRTKADGSLFKTTTKEGCIIPPFIRAKGLLRCRVPERVLPICITGCYNRYDCKVYRGTKRRHRSW